MRSKLIQSILDTIQGYDYLVCKVRKAIVVDKGSSLDRWLEDYGQMEGWLDLSVGEEDLSNQELERVYNSIASLKSWLYNNERLINECYN